MTKFVGKNLNRLDGIDKVTGAGKFASDMTAPGMPLRQDIAKPLSPCKNIEG